MADIGSLEIHKLKLFVTTNCNMGCGYCMIKNTQEYMSEEVARKGIQKYIFSSKSSNQKKFIYFFGGEPFLNFSLIQKMVDFVETQKPLVPFEIEYVICTNFTLVNEKIRDFIQNKSPHLSISLGGLPEDHNSHRTFRGDTKKESFQITVDHMNFLRQSNGKLPWHIGVGFVIVHNFVERLFTHFCYLSEEIGATHINFEFIISSRSWNYEEYVLFQKQYGKIVRYVLEEIEKGNFIYLNNWNWHIMAGILQYEKDTDSPFRSFCELYPSGDVMLSGFYSFLEGKKRKEVVVDNILTDESSIADAFLDPSFTHNYFRSICDIPQFSHAGAYGFLKAYMQKVDMKIIAFMQKKAQTNPHYKKYLENIPTLYF